MASSTKSQLEGQLATALERLEALEKAPASQGADVVSPFWNDCKHARVKADQLLQAGVIDEFQHLQLSINAMVWDKLIAIDRSLKPAKK